MNRQDFERALELTSALHRDDPAVADFCPFAAEVAYRHIDPFIIPAARALARDQRLGPTIDAALRDALVGLWDKAFWRETYRGTNIGEDFLARFGCYELAGRGGHFDCRPMRSFVVYSDADLYYPWHHHPSEELYLIVAGAALFEAEGQEPRVLCAGDTAFHAINQPHVMTTQDDPVLAYVLWRGPDMDTAPVLTDPDQLRA